MKTISLRDKIGQMLLVGFDGSQITATSPIVRQIDEFGIGGVILFDYDFKTKQFDKNIQNQQQLQQLNADLQKFNNTLNIKNNRANLPLFISVDYEGGFVDRLKERYGFPKTTAANIVGKMSDDDAIKAANAMAITLKELGFNLNFAPVLDVDVNPENPVLGKLGRCFSADPKQVTHFASIYADAFMQNDIKPAFKHFPGHGSSNADSHLGFVDVTEDWQPLELDPYKSLLQNEKYNRTMIMTAHIVNRKLDDSGLPATLSRKVLTDMLRNEMHFDGVIITDDMQMKAISEQYSLEESLPLAINAGVDMFIFGNQLSDSPEDFAKVIDIIEQNVLSGAIKHKLIDDSYARIVKLKQS
ncbi:MAG: glycoside hydrolase family 3 N-terminal domain-containing protein [Legionellaceae bacterium]|nr:glycoside hydrolase family 3 N-terminal domain-containing protein [Legionellaceae bacterium]